MTVRTASTPPTTQEPSADYGGRPSPTPVNGAILATVRPKYKNSGVVTRMGLRKGAAAKLCPIIATRNGPSGCVRWRTGFTGVGCRANMIRG